MAKPKDGTIVYSKEIKGEKGNYKWPVKFSLADGFLRISQAHEEETGHAKYEVTLLSPKQVVALLKFLKANS